MRVRVTMVNGAEDIIDNALGADVGINVLTIKTNTLMHCYVLHNVLKFSRDVIGEEN